MLSLFAERIGLVRAGVRDLFGSGPPTNLTTGVNDAGPGSTYTDVLTGVKYQNLGTALIPNWGTVAAQVTQTLTAARIVSVAAGDFGHAQGVILVPAPGAGKTLELISVVLMYDFAVAAFTGGGNITVNQGAGGAAITGLVSAANSVGAAADKYVQLVPLSTVGIPLVDNGPLNLVSSAAFTQPGTAAGTLKIITNYRVHSLAP